MPHLTEELRARIGETRAYVAPEPLSRASIRYFAAAVGDANPVYTDRAAAHAAGWRDVVAPPTLLTDSNQYAALPRDADGFAGHGWDIDVPGSRTVRGGNEYTFHRPAHPDDVLQVTWSLADIAERTRADGSTMIVVTAEQRITAADGDPILTNRETIIYLDVTP